MFDLAPKELMTLAIAAYAALVSTFVFGWDAYKWLHQGAKVKGYAQTGMKRTGGMEPDPNTLRFDHGRELWRSCDHNHEHGISVLRELVERVCTTQPAGPRFHHP